MDDHTLPLPGLSPVAGRPVKACFDGGSLSSDAGVLVLRACSDEAGRVFRFQAGHQSDVKPATVPI